MLSPFSLSHRGWVASRKGAFKTYSLTFPWALKLTSCSPLRIVLREASADVALKDSSSGWWKAGTSRYTSNGGVQKYLPAPRDPLLRWDLNWKCLTGSLTFRFTVACATQGLLFITVWSRCGQVPREGLPAPAVPSCFCPPALFKVVSTQWTLSSYLSTEASGRRKGEAYCRVSHN